MFLNQTDPAGQGSENQDTIEELKKFPALGYLDAPFGSRKAFAHAASLGLAVTELPRQHYNPKAVDEIMALFQGCFKVTMTSRKRRAAGLDHGNPFKAPAIAPRPLTNAPSKPSSARAAA